MYIKSVTNYLIYEDDHDLIATRLIELGRAFPGQQSSHGSASTFDQVVNSCTVDTKSFSTEIIQVDISFIFFYTRCYILSSRLWYLDGRSVYVLPGVQISFFLQFERCVGEKGSYFCEGVLGSGYQVMHDWNSFFSI